MNTETLSKQAGIRLKELKHWQNESCAEVSRVTRKDSINMWAIKGRIERTWAHSRRKLKTWLPNDVFASVITSKCSSHITKVVEGESRGWENVE